MPKIIARKCPFTRKLFEDEHEYGEHLVSLRKERGAHIRFRVASKGANAVVNRMRATVESLEDLHEFIVNNWEDFVIRGAVNSSRYWNREFPDLDAIKREKLQLNKLTFRACQYRSLLSNTHSCPIDGVMNFSCHSDEPRGYPGIRFDMSAQFDYLPGDCSPSDMFRNSCVNTGSGSSSRTSMGYGISVFLSDFPLMQKAFDQRMVEMRLMGEEPSNLVPSELKFSR